MAALFKRHSRRRGNHLFDDLPLEAQREAMWRYWRSCERWKGNLPSWRRAILIGQARRWAMTSPEERSRWGRSLLAKRGGYVVQNRYRCHGRTGAKHPAHKAARISASNPKSAIGDNKQKSATGDIGECRQKLTCKEETR